MVVQGEDAALGRQKTPMLKGGVVKLDVVRGSVTRGEPVNEVGDAVRKARRGYESDVLGLHRVCDGRAVRRRRMGR